MVNEYGLSFLYDAEEDCGTSRLTESSFSEFDDHPASSTPTHSVLPSCNRDMS